VTQAIISYTSPVSQACSPKAADLNRQISNRIRRRRYTITAVRSSEWPEAYL
jgi:hypothetical protein